MRSARGVRFGLVIVLVSAAAAACTGSASGHHALDGIGATQRQWNSSHTAVRARGCIAGQAYDPDPRLRAFPGCPGSKYVAVDVVRGRVDAYVVNFPAGATLARVLAAIRPELPGDAVRTSTSVHGSCTLDQFRSAALARIDRQDFPGGRIAVAAARAPDGRRYLDLLPIDLGASHVSTC